MGTLKLTPDVAEAQRFLDLLDAGGIFTFQTFDDDRDRKDGRLAHVFHGTLEQHQAALTQLQQNRVGIFVMINQGDGIRQAGNKTCRCAVNVRSVRSLFADLDGAPLEPALADDPDIVVQSSPGRWHTYWLTNDCPLNDFTMRQKQIAVKFSSDESVCDLSRVMRLPGFWHQKDEPFMTTMIFPKVVP